MSIPQIRLEKDVAVLTKKSADKNSRSLPKEVNHILREHHAFTAQVQQMGIKRKTG